MKAILVPTDFSNTARNAARYALEFARQVSIPKIILYNAYQAPYTADPTMPVMQLFDFEEVRHTSLSGLEMFRLELLPYAPRGIQIDIKSEFAILSDSIEETCIETGADIIIMGITGGSGIDVLVGSNTISVADKSKIPVIIVPLTASFKPIENIVMVCDFKNIGEATPVKSIRTILDETKAQLHVLNIEHNNGKKEKPQQWYILDKLLTGYAPIYQYVDSKSFADATNDFVDHNHVDMIITIPKKHGFFDSIFHRSHTKTLAFHTHVPLMCIHEEQVK